MKFNVPGMNCGHCTAAITKGIAVVDPNATVQTDLATHTVTVASERSATEIAAAIKSAGYDSTLA